MWACVVGSRLDMTKPQQLLRMTRTVYGQYMPIQKPGCQRRADVHEPEADASGSRPKVRCGERGQQSHDRLLRMGRVLRRDQLLGTGRFPLTTSVTTTLGE